MANVVQNVVQNGDRRAVISIMVKADSEQRWEVAKTICKYDKVELLSVIMNFSKEWFRPQLCILQYVNTLEMAKEAVRLGAILSTMESTSYALNHAVHINNYELVEYFVMDLGAQINFDAITAAAVHNKIKILTFFLDKISREEMDCVFRFMLHAVEPADEVIQLLLDRGCKWSVERLTGLICDAGYVETLWKPKLITMCLDSIGDKISRTDLTLALTELTALHSKNIMGIAKRLLDLGACLEGIPCYGILNADFFRFYISHDELFNLLVEDDYILKLVTSNFIKLGDLDVVMLLRNKGVELGYPELIHAFKHEQIHIADFLVSVCKLSLPVVEDFPNYERVVANMERYRKLRSGVQRRALRKIQDWWIPICYDIRRPCGMRMFERNWEDSCRIMGWAQ